MVGTVKITVSTEILSTLRLIVSGSTVMMSLIVEPQIINPTYPIEQPKHCKQTSATVATVPSHLQE